MMRKLKVIADVTGKAICTPIILFYAALVFPWLDMYFWWS